MTTANKHLGYIKISLFAIICLILLVVLPINTQATGHQENDTYQGGDYYYVDKQNEEYWVVASNLWHKCDLYDNSDNLASVTDEIRTAMINREDSLSFYFVTDKGKFDNVDIFEVIDSELYTPTSDIRAGDYLKMMANVDTYSYAKQSVPSCDDYDFYKISLNFKYITTANQEEQIKEFVEDWTEQYINSNSVISASTGDERDYYIVKTIYNFVAKNADYNFDLYNDTNNEIYPVDSDEYKISHSAYGALFGNIEGSYDDDFKYMEISNENGDEIHTYKIDITYSTDGQGLYRINKRNQGKAVCDGYSLLFYYLCEYNGIDCRVIEGAYDNNEDPHAWNIVKLKDCYDTDYEWYQIDTTFASQRTQKISDTFTAVSYDFFLRGSNDESFSSENHQSAYDEYSNTLVGLSENNYRFNITNIDESKVDVFVSRRRYEDESDKTITNGEYNLENYVIIDPNNNYYKINDTKDDLVSCDGFTYNSNGYWYSFELYDFAKGIEYNTEDVYLLDVGTYSFNASTIIGGHVYSKKINITPLDMSSWSSYDLSKTEINGNDFGTVSTPTEILTINAQFIGAPFSINAEIYDSAGTKLVLGTDYSYYCYLNGDSKKTPVSPTDPNSYIISIEYGNNYCGSIEIPFVVEKADLSNYNYSYDVSTTYGEKVENYISSFIIGNNNGTTKLTKGVDYEVTSVKGGLDYQDTGVITITALDSSKYLKAGTSATLNYEVARQRDVSNTFNSMVIKNEKYCSTGKEIKPTDFKMKYVKSDGTVVELVLNKDYQIVGYSNNINPGTASVNVKFIGNYKGQATLYFTIIGYTPTFSKTTFTYNGKVQRPSVTIKDSTGRQLVYKTDFKVSYSNANSTNAGTYKMTITFIGNYTGSQTINYTIKQKSAPSTITVSKTTFTYNGKVQRPTITVKDGNTQLTYKTDFTVSFSNINSTAVGKYTATVKFIGNYTGSKSYTYYINPKGTSIASISASSKGFTVKWNKQSSQTTGYQIQYSTKSNFANSATVYGGNANTTSKKITGRAGKTRYYVRVRTYKNINGKYYYSSWSSAKSVVTLK